MIITISGKSGAGKSTAVKALAKKLHFPRYGIGDMRRLAAEEKGMTLEKFNAMGEDDPRTDKIVDDYQKKLGETEDNIIVDGRLSWYFIPKSFKIFLTVSSEEGARRVYEACLHGQRASESDEFSSEQFVLESNQRRMESDQKRYQQYYGVDPYLPEHYDLVIDTTNLSPEETFANLIEAISERLEVETRLEV